MAAGGGSDQEDGAGPERVVVALGERPHQELRFLLARALWEGRVVLGVGVVDLAEAELFEAVALECLDLVTQLCRRLLDLGRRGVAAKVGAQTSSVGEQSSAARPIVLSYCTHLRNSTKMVLCSSLLQKVLLRT